MTSWETYLDSYSSKGKVLKAVSDIIFEETGLRPYPEQMKAAKALAKGMVVDQKTGEGKTITVLAALLLVLREGRKVFVSTANDYLCERDYLYSKKLLEGLGYRTVLLKEGTGGTEKTYNDADVIYATGETLIFDYLRGIKADYDFVIIDEIDHILVESAGHDFSVSDGRSGVQMPAGIFMACAKIAELMSCTVKTERDSHITYLFEMQEMADVIVQNAKKSIEITEAGYEKAEEILGMSARDPLWREILLASLEARHLYHRDEDYIVKDGKIQIINGSTGRVSEGGSNGPILQTAIEIKEHLPVTDKAIFHSTCSFPVFFSMFRTLSGISGTAVYAKDDFAGIFGKRVKKIPTHFPERRKEEHIYCETDEIRIERIREIAAKTKGPVLIAASSDAKAEALFESLWHIPKRVSVLLNSNIETEDDAIRDAGKAGNVLISSKIVGRGTDIKTEHEEGLTCIIAERFFSRRAERQLAGRTARNGQTGTCYIMTCPEDPLFELQRKKRFTERDVMKLQKKWELAMVEVRKHIFIRSRLFFDQDAAIRKRLESLKTSDEIAGCLEKEDCLHIVLAPLHTALLLKLYEKRRPCWQAQFIAYNDSMADTLYTADGFNERCHEYTAAGNEILKDVLNEFCSILKTGAEEDAGRKEKVCNKNKDKEINNHSCITDSGSRGVF